MLGGFCRVLVRGSLFVGGFCFFGGGLFSGLLCWECVVSGNQLDRNDYSVGASQVVQGNFEVVASELEAALDRRDADVKQAMSAYQADGVSDEYAHLEQRWNMAGRQVREVIGAIRQSLAENDDVAVRALSTARSAVPE